MKPLPKNFLAIGDIHGDVEALRRGLDFASLRGLPPVCFGDIVGGQYDLECVEILQRLGCVVLRGNHDQWAVERNEQNYPDGVISWLNSLSYKAENPDSIALHTAHEVVEETKKVRWFELQSSFEVEHILEEYSTKRFVFAAHSHMASVSEKQQKETKYISRASLRAEPHYTLSQSRYFIDVGCAKDNVAIFSSDAEFVEFTFFD